MAKNKTYRFAFGSPGCPASPVWRLSVDKKGDVYIGRIAALGNDFHVSLHATGKSHLKMGKERDVFPDPISIGKRLMAFRVIFRPIERNLRPQLSEEKKETSWLGLPKPLHFFVVEFFYLDSCLDDDDLSPHERGISLNIPAIFRNKRKFMNVTLSHVQYSIENLLQISQTQVHDIVVNYKNEVPANFEKDVGLSVYSISILHGVPTFIEESFQARAQRV